MTDELSELRKRIQTLEHLFREHVHITELRNLATGQITERQVCDPPIQYVKPDEPQSSTFAFADPGKYMVGDKSTIDFLKKKADSAPVNKPAESLQVGEDVETLARIISTSNVDIVKGGFTAIAQRIVSKIKAGQVPGIYYGSPLFSTRVAMPQLTKERDDLRKQLEEALQARDAYNEERFRQISISDRMRERIKELEAEMEQQRQSFASALKTAGDIPGLMRTSECVDALRRIAELNAELNKADRRSAEQERIITVQRERLEKAMAFHACFEYDRGWLMIKGSPQLQSFKTKDLPDKWLATKP